MPGFVIDIPELPSVAVAGSGERFPVRRIFCVGRNYAAHAREMGKDPTASRHSSSPSRPMPWPTAAPSSPTRRLPAICTMRSNWSWRWPAAARISRR